MNHKLGKITVMLGALASVAAADAAERKAVVGRCLTPSASLLRREAGQPWKPVAEKEEVRAGELLLSVPMALVELKSGLRLEMLADLEGKSPYPIVESVVELQESADVSLDFRLDRGRVTVINPKETPAKARVRFHKETWKLELQPGARVGLEIFGRWPKGSIFSHQPGDKEAPKEGPHLDLVVLMLKGEIHLETDCHRYLMQAPPGPAFFQWDSVTGCDARPQRMDKLPAWAEPIDLSATPAGRLRQARIDRFRRLILDKSIEAAVDEFLRSEDPRCRRGAVYILAALDDLPRLGAAILHAQHADVWDNGVLALRHWLGRGPGQDVKFFNFLVQEQKVPRGQAMTVLNLTRSFSDHDLASPELYEMLIDYLKHERLAIRGLAHWHLVRLVPEGRRIKFSVESTPDERAQAFAEWKKLIPDGKMPPKPKKSEE